MRGWDTGVPHLHVRRSIQATRFGVRVTERDPISNYGVMKLRTLFVFSSTGTGLTALLFRLKAWCRSHSIKFTMASTFPRVWILQRYLCDTLQTLNDLSLGQSRSGNSSDATLNRLRDALVLSFL